MSPIAIMAWAASAGLSCHNAYEEHTWARADVTDGAGRSYSVVLRQSDAHIARIDCAAEGAGATLDEAWAAVREKEPA